MLFGGGFELLRQIKEEAKIVEKIPMVTRRGHEEASGSKAPVPSFGRQMSEEYVTLSQKRNGEGRSKIDPMQGLSCQPSEHAETTQKKRRLQDTNQDTTPPTLTHRGF